MLDSDDLCRVEGNIVIDQQIFSNFFNDLTAQPNVLHL